MEPTHQKKSKVEQKTGSPAEYYLKTLGWRFICITLCADIFVFVIFTQPASQLSKNMEILMKNFKLKVFYMFYFALLWSLTLYCLEMITLLQHECISLCSNTGLHRTALTLLKYMFLTSGSFLLIINYLEKHLINEALNFTEICIY